MLFNGQEYIMELVEKRGYKCVYNYEQRYFQFSNELNKELSENTEWLKRMEKVSNIYGIGTFILDRAFDGAVLMEKIIEMCNDFIVRAKSLTRNVYVWG